MLFIQRDKYGPVQLAHVFLRLLLMLPVIVPKPFQSPSGCSTKDYQRWEIIMGCLMAQFHERGWKVNVFCNLVHGLLVAAFLVRVGESGHKAGTISSHSRPAPCSVNDIPAECCRVDRADSKCRINVNIVMKNSICKKGSRLDCVGEKTPYLPGINLRCEC